MQESEAAGLGFRTSGGAGLEQWGGYPAGSLSAVVMSQRCWGILNRDQEMWEGGGETGSGQGWESSNEALFCWFFVCLASLSLSFLSIPFIQEEKNYAYKVERAR